jgi:hypothetical protein
MSITIIPKEKQVNHEGYVSVPVENGLVVARAFENLSCDLSTGFTRNKYALASRTPTISIYNTPAQVSGNQIQSYRDFLTFYFFPQPLGWSVDFRDSAKQLTDVHPYGAFTSRIKGIRSSRFAVFTEIQPSPDLCSVDYRDLTLVGDCSDLGEMLKSALTQESQPHQYVLYNLKRGFDKITGYPRAAEGQYSFGLRPNIVASLADLMIREAKTNLKI